MMGLSTVFGVFTLEVRIVIYLRDSQQLRFLRTVKGAKGAASRFCTPTIHHSNGRARLHFRPVICPSPSL